MNQICKKFVSIVLMSLTALQPALAAEYRIPLSWKVRQLPIPAPGTGVGDVDAGDDPEAAGKPALYFSTDGLSFDITTTRTEQSAFLVNRGNGPAVLSGITSTDAFSITSDCPAELSAGTGCAISVTPTETAVNGSQARVTVRAPGADEARVLQLTAYAAEPGLPRPILNTTPPIIFLGELNPGEQSSTGAARLTNIGSAPASITGFESTDNFIVSHDCPDSLAVGESCSVAGKFLSYASGGHYHTLKLGLAGYQGTYPVTFYAEVKRNPSLAPKLTLSNPRLFFNKLAPGASETLKTTLSNEGTTSAVLKQPVSTAEFAIQSNCPEVLGIGAACDVSVTFNALTAGTQPARDMVIRAQDGVYTRLFVQGEVTGTHLPDETSAAKLVFTPPGLSFTNLPVGQSKTLTAELTNQGNVAASIRAAQVEFVSDVFTQTNDCGNTLAPGATCTLTVTFKPIRPESRTGRITLQLDKDQVALPLYGQGIQAVLGVAPLAVDFGTIALPGASSSQTVGVGNSGNVLLTGLTVTNSDPQLAVDYGTCTSTLAANRGCQLSVQYQPVTEGPFTSSFQVASDDGGATTINITGTAVRVSASPSTVKFSDTGIGKVAPDQTVTLSNSGIAPLSISGIGVSRGVDQFSQSNNCGTSLAAGASCTITVRYAATTEGAYLGELGVASGNLPVARVTLRGFGLPRPALQLTPASVPFPDMNVGLTSDIVNLTLSNPSDEPATLIGAGISIGESDYGQSNDCGTSLPAGASCTISVQWKPTAVGLRTGSVSVASSFGNLSAHFSGTATTSTPEIDEPGGPGPGPGPGGPEETPPIDDFTHYAIRFLDTEVGTSSAVRNVLFRNKGDGPLTVTGISLVTGKSDYSQSNDCAKVLAPGASCTISLMFTPSALDKRTGGIALISDNGKFYFDLTGKGIGANAQWYPDSSASFGEVPVGGSAQRGFTLVNAGTVTARELAVAVTGPDVSLVSNTCTDTLAQNASCRVVVQYAPKVFGKLEGATVVASGRLANTPAIQALTGESPAPALSFSDSNGNYGAVSPGANITRTFVVLNSGKYADTLSSLIIEGTDFIKSGGTCKDGSLLNPGGACTVSVTASPSGAGSVTGKLIVSSVQGAKVELALSATSVQSSYTVSGSLSSNTPPPSNFGQVTVGAATPGPQYFYLRDSTNQAIVAANSIRVVGDNDFVVTDIYSMESTGQAVAVCTSNASGSTASCLTGAPARVIRVGVKFTPSVKGMKSATLRFEHNGSQGISTVALQGEAVFDATGNWSTTPSATVAPTTASQNYGAISPNSTIDKTFYVRNEGKNGAQSVGFKLTGDTAQFKIVQSYIYTSGGASWTCVPGGEVSANKDAVADCTATDPASNPYNHVGITVRFAPSASGTYSVTLTPSSTSGSPVPAPIVLTGTAQFNPAMTWATTATPNASPTQADRTYGPTLHKSAAVEKTFFLKNNGTNGAPAVSFKLSGSSQFELVQSYVATAGGSIWSCSNGASTVSADKQTLSSCLGIDPATGNAYTWIGVTVRYNPKTLGTVTTLLSATSDNGTIVPGTSLELTGTAVFDANGVWANNLASTSPLTASDRTFGLTAVGGSQDKTFVLRNEGKTGALEAGFTLTGDVSQFEIVQSYVGTNQGATWTCISGGVVAANKLSTTPCLAGEISSNQYSQVVLVVKYAPKASGTAVVTVTPHTTNGSKLPEPITITGTAP